MMISLALMGCLSCSTIENNEEKELIYALAKIDTMAIRLLKENERSGEKINNITGETEIWVTNSCGKSIVTFRILKATIAIPQELSTELSIGEWCRLSYDFPDDFLYEYFLIIKNDKIVKVEPVSITSAGDRVLSIDQSTLNTWNNDFGPIDSRLIISKLSSPIPVFEGEELDDLDIDATVSENQDLMTFKDEEGNAYIGRTRGIIIDSLF